jgi:hypothetical protein
VEEYLKRINECHYPELVIYSYSSIMIDGGKLIMNLPIKNGYENDRTRIEIDENGLKLNQSDRLLLILKKNSIGTEDILLSFKYNGDIICLNKTLGDIDRWGSQWYNLVIESYLNVYNGINTETGKPSYSERLIPDFKDEYKGVSVFKIRPYEINVDAKSLDIWRMAAIKNYQKKCDSVAELLEDPKSRKR